MIELVVCPLCGNVIHRHRRHQEVTRVTYQVGRDTGEVALLLHQLAEKAHAEELADAREACVIHNQRRHRLRYSFWRRYGWRWLLTWPRKQPKPIPSDYQSFEPLSFLTRR